MEEIRIIDANALQKEFIKETGKRSLLVDTAPTIEPEFIKELMPEVLAIIKEVMPQIIELAKENQRSPGKWEEPFEMNGKSYHKCTNCHISSELILIDKYCPNCGADMRGGRQ